MLTTIWLAFLAAAIPLSIAIISTTVYLHRSATHGALTLHPLALLVFKFATWLTTGIKPWEWVAVHRKHHHDTDRLGDPHSPYLEGFWHIQLGNVFYYARAVRDPKVHRFASDILAQRTWVDRNIFGRGYLGLILGIAILCWLFGFKIGLLAALIHALLYVFVLSSSVNGLCHHKHFTGYQLYRREHVVKVFNNLLVALFTFGEGLHHNHHHQQSLARFWHRWWELIFDWGFILINVMEKLHLATNVKRRLPS